MRESSSTTSQPFGPAQQSRVRARDLVVPGQHDVLVGAAADGDRRAVVAQAHGVLLAARVVEDHEGAPAALGLDAVGEDRVGARELAGLGQRDAELHRQVAPGGVFLGQQRHRALEQVDRRADVSARERAGARRSRAGSRRAPPSARPWSSSGPELGQVVVGALEVVAEDLVVLAGALAGLALDPVGEARVQIAARPLRMPP